MFKKNKELVELMKKQMEKLEERIENLETVTPRYRIRKKVDDSLIGMLKEIDTMRKIAKESIDEDDYYKQIFYYFVKPIIDNVYHYEEYENTIIFLSKTIWEAKEKANEEV